VFQPSARTLTATTTFHHAMSVRILSSHQLMMAAAASTLACATSTTVFQLVIAHAQPAMSLHDTSHLDSAARPLPASRSQPPLPQQSVQLKPPLLVAWMTILHHQSQTLRLRQQRPLLLRSCQLIVTLLSLNLHIQFIPQNL